MPPWWRCSAPGSSPADPKRSDSVVLDKCWFGGETDPARIAELLVDGADEPENNARASVTNPQERPLELAGAVNPCDSRGFFCALRSSLFAANLPPTQSTHPQPCPFRGRAPLPWSQQSMTTSADQNDSLDLVWGAKAIGQIINKPQRATFYLLESGALPARKIGSQWVASRRRLLAFLLGEAA